MSEHRQEQGLRVHHLVNLGGLIAIAGLDQEPPIFLLGALMSMAHERARLTPEHLARIGLAGAGEARRVRNRQTRLEIVGRSRDLHSLS